MVLLEVDGVRTLLLSQRVSQTFSGTIEGSLALQTKLWSRQDLEWKERAHPDYFDLNPPLQGTGPWWDYYNPESSSNVPLFALRRQYVENSEIGASLNALGSSYDQSWRRMLLLKSGRDRFHLVVSVGNKHDDYGGLLAVASRSLQASCGVWSREARWIKHGLDAASEP
ncbi:hypothetical protein AC579_3244 [Pseudocercospora musae]|uniref:Uncharacterized protein n=1 Tax=Pseudocercospora musae TaxID=113226 RepID=A0A139HZR9_9PEZI|nr:hypothetical protein AC579_3244 [Pseudocercospora musae]